MLLSTAAETVTNCSMELGGNAPFLVFDDADLDAADRRRVDRQDAQRRRGLHRRQPVLRARGGRRRVHAPSSPAAGGLNVGPGLDDGIDLGPLVNEDTRSKVASLVEAATKDGSRVVTGGQAPDRRGYFYQPTVLDDVPPDAGILGEEIFGPVAPIVRFTDADAGDRAGQQHRVRPGLLPLHARPAPRPAGRRGAGGGHGRHQPRRGVRPGRSVRRRQAVGPRPRGRRTTGLLEFTETKYIAVDW